MKPFTSKHCMQYLTKESPLYQGLKQLHNRPVQQEPMESKPDVEPINLPELAKPELKKLKQLHNRPVQQKPMVPKRSSVEPMNLPELVTPKLKK